MNQFSSTCACHAGKYKEAPHDRVSKRYLSAEMKVVCLLSLALTAAVLLHSVNGTPSQQSSHVMSDAAGDRYLVCKIYGVE